MEQIGYQNGIVAAVNRLRDLDPAGTLLVKTGGKWPSIDTIQNVPLENWKAWDKFQRTLTILKDDHDGDPDPPDPPAYLKVAPRVAFAQGGSDARFCVINQPGVTQRPDGKYTDESGAVYTNADGLDESGIRSGEPAVTGAKEINGRPYCSLPTTGSPTENTGSWKV